MFDKITDRQAKATLTQQFQEKMLEFKKKTLFPPHAVPLEFEVLLNTCFKFVSPNHLQMRWKEYQAIRAIDNSNYCLLDMGTVLYVFQQRTQAELMMEDEEYTDYSEQLERMMITWQGIVSKEEQRVEDFLQSAELNRNSGDYKKPKTIPVSKEEATAQ